MRMRKCKNCKAEFMPQRMGQTACSIACAYEMAKRKREKVERANDRQKRDSLKSRAQWMREAQAAFNAFIRARDADQPCISCGRHHDGQYHAGHYLSTGARPELRFDEMNVHKQCQPCNTHLSGNLIMYRRAMVAKYGVDAVEALEGPHDQKKYTVGDLLEIKAEYRLKEKEIANAS